MLVNVRNRIVFHAAPARVSEILHKIQEDTYGIGSIDFNKIMPVPNELLAYDIAIPSLADRAVEIYLTSINPLADYFAMKKAGGIEYASICAMLNSHDSCIRFAGLLSLEDVVKNVRNCKRFSGGRLRSIEEIILYGKGMVENFRLYGYLDKNRWMAAHWGSDRNAFNFGDYAGEQSRISFSTSCNAVPEILILLSEMYPDVRLDYRWADEDIACNTGAASFYSGKELCYYSPEDESLEAYELAYGILGLEV